MKKLVIIATMLMVSSIAFAQSYYFKSPKKTLTYQVAPTYFVYNGDLFGAQMGVNYKEVFNIGYFHTRSYQFKENFMDDRFSGIQSSIVFPIFEQIQIGPSVRVGTYNEVWQKVFWGVEARFDISKDLKFAIEYGKGESKGFGLKVIWNMY